MAATNFPLLFFFGGSEVKESACNAGDLGLIPGSGRSPGEGNGNPLQYSCLENPLDGGVWWATVHRVAKSQTRLSDFAHTPLQYFSSQAPTFHPDVNVASWALVLSYATNTSFPSCATSLFHVSWLKYFNYKFGNCSRFHCSLLPCLLALWPEIVVISCLSLNTSFIVMRQEKFPRNLPLGIYGENFRGTEIAYLFKMCIIFWTIFYFQESVLRKISLLRGTQHLLCGCYCFLWFT